MKTIEEQLQEEIIKARQEIRRIERDILRITTVLDGIANILNERNGQDKKQMIK